MSTEEKVRKRRLSGFSDSGSHPRSVSWKSVGRSTFSEGLDARHNSKWLGGREWLLLLVEAAMSLTAYSIRERTVADTELARHKLTYQAIEVEMLHLEGYSTLIGMFVGYMADSYIRYHTLALLSVMLHFSVMCMVAMEYAINLGLDSEDYPYENLVLQVCIVALVLIKSTDFTRLVYGLEGMVSRRQSTICTFIFLHFWMSSSATYGGVFVNFFLGLFNLDSKIVPVSFAMCGLNLFLFAIFLRPETHEEHKGLSCQVIGCLLSATFRKVCVTSQRGKRGFFGHVEDTYDKTTISKTKALMRIYVALLSALGISFGTLIREGIFYDFSKIKLYKLPVVLTRLYSATKLTAMLLVYFIIWPSLALIWRLRGRNHLKVKYLLGHFLAIWALFYVALWMGIVEPLPRETSSGYVRIFNTVNKPVQFTHADELTTHDYTVDHEKGVMLSLTCSRPTLFPMTVAFKGGKNLTMFLSVTPGELTGYMVIDPLQVIRIRGFIPLREGPPGTNKSPRPRIYMYNTAVSLNNAPVLIKHSSERKMLTELVIRGGLMTTFSLEPCIYDFRIPKAGLSLRSEMREGGVYGLMIYAMKTVRSMSIDTVVEPNTASPWGPLGFYILLGMAVGLAYPSLQAAVYLVAPHGLTAMCFAFFTFLEGVTFWIAYIGFKTWHNYVTDATLCLYASFMTVFFLISIFLFLKLKDRLP